MRCSCCDWINPEGSRFCNRCGTPDVPPTARAHRAPAPAPDPQLTQRLGSPDLVGLAAALERSEPLVIAAALDARSPAATAPIEIDRPSRVSSAPITVIERPSEIGVAPTVRAPIAPSAVAHLDVVPARASLPAALPVAVIGTSAPAAPAPVVSVAPSSVAPAATRPFDAAPAATKRAPRETEATPAKSAKRRATPDGSAVSLAAIGVRSSRRTWALIACAGALILGVGVAAGLFLGRPSTQAAVAVAADELSDLDPIPTAAAAPLPTPPEGTEPPDSITAAARSSSSRRSTGGSTRSLVERSTATARGSNAVPVPAGARGTKVRLPRERGPSGDIAELPPPDTSDTPASRSAEPEGPETSSTTPAPWTSDAPEAPAAAPAPEPSPRAPARRSSREATRSDQPAPSLEDAAMDMRGSGSDTDVDDADMETAMYASRVRSVIRTYYRPRAQTCFDRALRNDPELRGTIMMRFNIAGSGQVSGARVVSNSTNHDEVGRCIVSVVNGWRLPPPPNDEAVQIEMPFSR